MSITTYPKIVKSLINLVLTLGIALGLFYLVIQLGWGIYFRGVKDCQSAVQERYILEQYQSMFEHFQRQYPQTAEKLEKKVEWE